MTETSPVVLTGPDPFGRRCRILVAPGDGHALSVGRLAAGAEVSPATASAHLRKLVAGGLLAVDSEGGTGITGCPALTSLP